MKFIKAVSIFLCAIMMMLPLSFTVSANELLMPRAETDIFYTPAMNAGTTWSGFDEDCVHDMACGRHDLTGESITIYFYNTGVDMPSHFVRSTSRTGLVTVKEDDFGPNTNETLFTKLGLFETYDNGLYRLKTWYGASNVYGEDIENNNNLELYILVDIDTKPGDTGTHIEPKFIAYRFGTTY